jgi:glutathione S-transferase
LRARSSLGVELDPYPALAGWLERLSERPAVAAELELQLQTAAPAEAGTASDATSQATSRTL